MLIIYVKPFLVSAEKWTSLLIPFVSYKEIKVLQICPLKVTLMLYILVKPFLVSAMKWISLLGPFVSYKEIKVLQIWSLKATLVLLCPCQAFPGE